MNVEPPETFVIIESIVYKSNGFAIALIDEYFDYKHERQANLAEIKASRQARISF
jgi:hypothetical protein